MVDAEDPPIWKRIRDAVSSNRMFKFNIAHHSVEHDMYADRLLEDGVVTISDWGLARTGGVELAEDGSLLEPDTVRAPYGDSMKGSILWDEIRDVLHEEIYPDENTKMKSGKAVGNIRTFVEEVDPGDVLLVNLPDGIVPCLVDGPTVYDRSAEYSNLAPDHIMYREVRWATDRGTPLAVSPDLLPPGFGTARHTIERVSDPSPMVELLRVVEWIDDSLADRGSPQIS